MQRLVIPLVLLAVALGAWFGADRMGNEEVRTPIDEPLKQASTPMLSARRMPEFLVQPIATDALAAELNDIVAEEFGGSCLYVTEGDEVLYDHQSSFGYTPASLQKILTAFAALEALGPNYRFETRVMGESLPQDGIVQGNLYLVGGGDPVLMTSDYAGTFDDQPQIRTPIEDLVGELVADGITQINGGVWGVEVRYDDDRYPDAWPSDGRFATQGQSGPLSALMINDGFEEYPPSDGARLLGETPTPVDDPALHAAQLFDDLLEARGILVSSGSRNVPRSDFDTVSDDLLELASIESPPLSELIRQMLVMSDNTTAELLLKAIGLSENNAGTTVVGARASAVLASEAGLPDLEVPPVDGSGLAGANKLSCQYVVELLQRAQPGTPLGDALPVAGQDGTLADRFLGTPAEGRVHAKTGSLSDVTALAGWVEADEGKILQFAYIVNLTEGRQVTDDLIDLQDDLGVALVQYPVGPSVAEIAPEGASQLAAEALGIDAEDLGIEPDSTEGSLPGDEGEPVDFSDAFTEDSGDSEG